MRFDAEGTYIREIVSNGWGNLDTFTVRPVRAHFTLKHESRFITG